MVRLLRPHLIAIVLALLVAFWLELSSADSAAVCVAILAQPTRGQALSKAIYRMGATVVGATVAVLICALFPQDRLLLLGGVGLWLAFCTFLGTLERDFRAYGAMLSGYTAATVSVGVIVINQPDTVFMTALDRVAVIAVGVISSTVINSVFASPAAWTRLADALRAQAKQVRHVFDEALAGRPIPDEEDCAALANRILQLGSQVSYARTELQDGDRRAAGARSVILALLELLSDSRAIATVLASDEPSPPFVARLRQAPAGDAGLDALMPGDPPLALADAFLLERTSVAREQQALVRDGLRTLEHGSAPARIVSLAIHQDLYAGLLNAIRVLIGYAIGSTFCILSGLSDSSILLINVAAFCALSSINPNPNAFGWGVLTGAPLAVALAAIVTFFPLTHGASPVILALSLLPVVCIGCVLSLYPKTASTVFVTLVWLFIVMSPSNPQSFDLLAFSERGLLLVMSGAIIFLSLVFLLPASPRRRVFRLADAIARDLETGSAGDERCA